MANQLVHIRADQHHTRLGRALQAARQVDGVARDDEVAVLIHSTDHETGVDADAQSQG